MRAARRAARRAGSVQRVARQCQARRNAGGEARCEAECESMRQAANEGTRGARSGEYGAQQCGARGGRTGGRTGGSRTRSKLSGGGSAGALVDLCAKRQPHAGQHWSRQLRASAQRARLAAALRREGAADTRRAQHAFVMGTPVQINGARAALCNRTRAISASRRAM